MLAAFIVSALLNREWVKRHKGLTIYMSIVLVALCVFVFTTDYGLFKLMYL